MRFYLHRILIYHLTSQYTNIIPRSLFLQTLNLIAWSFLAVQAIVATSKSMSSIHKETWRQTENENNHNGSKHQRRLYLHRILIYHLKSQIHQHNTKTLSPQTLNLLAGNFYAAQANCLFNFYRSVACYRNYGID